MNPAIRLDALIGTMQAQFGAARRPLLVILTLQWLLSMASDLASNYSPSAGWVGIAATSIGATFLSLLQIRLCVQGRSEIRASAARLLVALVLLKIVTGLGVALASLLLILPGLYLASRWSIAEAVLVAEGSTIGDAIAQSWARTSAAALPIAALILASLLLLIAWGALVVWADAAWAEAWPLWFFALSNILPAVFSVATTQIGIAAYTLLAGDGPAADAEIFG